MSMVEEAGAREGELKEQVMENVVRSRQLESELAGERAKVSKLADEVAEKELEKEALLRSCEQMTEELKVKASEQRALEERIEQVVATTLHDAEVAATEMEELRQRLHEVEREKLGKTEECDRLSNEVAVLMRELNEAKARESALMSVSELPVVGPRVLNTSSSLVLDSQTLATSVGLSGDVSSAPPNDVFPSSPFNYPISSPSSFIPGCHDDRSFSRNHHKDYCPMTLSSFYASLLDKVFLLQHFVSDTMNIASVPSSFLEFPILSSSVSSLTAQLSSLLFDLKFAFHSLALASSAMDVGSNPNNDRISPFTFQPFDSSFLSSAADFLTTNCDRNHDQECDSSSIAKSILCVAACLHAQLRRSIYQAFGCAQEKSTLDDEVEFLLSSWFDFFSKLQNLCQRASSKLRPTPNVPIAGLTCICHLAPAEVDQQLNAKSSLKSEPLFRTSPLAPTFSAEFLSLHATKPKLLTKYYSQSEPNLDLSTEQDLQKRRVVQSLDAFLQSLSTYTGHYKKLSPFPLATLANQLSKLRLWLVDDTRQPFIAPTVRKASYPSVSFEIPSTELYLRRLLNIRDTEVLYLLNNLPGGENLISRSSTSNFFPSRDCTEAQLELMSNWDMVQPIDPSCLPVYRVKLPEVRELPAVTNGHHYGPPTAEALLSSQNDLPPRPSTPASEISHNSLNLESRSEIKSLLRRCWNLLKEMVSIVKRSSRSKLLRTRADELLDTSLRLSRLLNGDASASLVYEAVADTAAHVDFKRIPDSPSPPRSWSKAPIQELIWAIETLDDIEELRSLAHLLTQQYNAIGTTLEQQLNVNRNLRDRLREANNHLARIYLGISQGSQRLAVMTGRLLVEAQKQDGINSTCDDFVPLKPYSQSLISEDDVEACAQSGSSDPSALANLPSSSQKTERHRTATLLRNLRHAMRPKSKKIHGVLVNSASKNELMIIEITSELHCF
uniref:Uncharacterized protein n=1 Tax=Echinococcus canadensis TaxID=519352 RepID=A0A915EX99_9CEST